VQTVVRVQAAMNTTKMALLFLSMIVLGATAHRLLEATSQKTGALHEAEEHQRILAELEEVHQLRERMLQQGQALSLIHLCTCAIIAFAPMHPGARNRLLVDYLDCFTAEPHAATCLLCHQVWMHTMHAS